MTLVIGLLCSDGVVMGADGAATLGTVVERTIVQPARKLEIIGGSVILGISGPIGIGQRFKHELEQVWNQKGLSGKKPAEAMSIMREAFWKHLEGEWKAAGVVSAALGNNVAVQSVLCHTLVAVPVSKSPCLFQFNHQASPEQATTDLPFVSIGSAQSIADPFLAFVRRVFWQDKLPSLVEGVFAVLWTLDHAIRTNPGGVADPRGITILEKDSKREQWQAREVPGEELQEHYEAIADAEKSLATFRQVLRDEDTGQVKALPTTES